MYISKGSARLMIVNLKGWTYHLRYNLGGHSQVIIDIWQHHLGDIKRNINSFDII